MITNNSFLDGIIHRQMRKHLLETFDDIYILDLHGNSKKKEKAPDGGKDVNVFDIQQGVAISIFVRIAGEKKGLGTVHHAELYGKREEKYKTLTECDLQNIKWKKLNYSEPYYFFVPKDNKSQLEYKKYLPIDRFFIKQSSGITTSNDKDMVSFKPFEDLNIKYDYKPFDIRNLKYSDQLGRPRKGFTENFFKKNVAITLMRKPVNSIDFSALLVVQNMIDKNYYGFQSYAFPLYLYSKDGLCVPNLKKEIVDEIENIVGKITPEDIFDYIYAVLHSPSYREKYKEFLKIDFPRVPYPKGVKSFKKLVTLGTELRLLHLLESPKVNQFITTYPTAGSDIVEKLIYKDGNVFINKDQYFGNVPESAWNFYIGGYQPAQKWLKDRKGRTLTNADIEHYQKIIVALAETERIMKQIDKDKWI
jgi:predicted helicase